MNQNQNLDIKIYEPRTLRIKCLQPTQNVAIDVTVNGIKTTYSSNDTNIIHLHKDDNIHYKIYDTNEYDNTVIGADGYAPFEDDIILKDNTVIQKSLIASYTIEINLNGSTLPYGSNTITLKDSSDNVIEGATITIKDNGEIINTYTTDDKGQAVISELAQEYDIEIEKEDFDTYTGTIKPDSLYYVCIRVDKLNDHGGTWHNVLGLSMANSTTDLGNPKPWLGLNNVHTLDFSETFDFAGGGSMSEFGGNKPYVGFRTQNS